MSFQDPVVDGRITRRQALIGAGGAALGVSLFGPSSLSKFSPFGAQAGAATGGSPFPMLVRPGTNLDSYYQTLTNFPDSKYIQSFIAAASGDPSAPSGPGGTPNATQYMPAYGPQWLAYVKAGSVYRAEVGGDPGDALYASDAWVLKDTVYNRPIIGPVTGSEYMPDLTNSAFRQFVIDICQRAINKGHTGIWLDNILNPIYSYYAQPTTSTTTMLGKPGPGGVVPQAKRPNGTVITTADWNAANAALMTELRTALGPNVPILANVLSYAPYDEGDGLGGTFNNANYVTVAQKATFINREIWTVWGNTLVDGPGMASQFANVDGTRAAVPGSAFCFESYPTNSAYSSATVGREYALAAAYLVANGSDVLSDQTAYGTLNYTGYHLDLGAPSGARSLISGASYAWKRTFANGFVAFNAESTAVSVNLGSTTYRKLDGSTVTGTISLPANRGLVLTTGISAVATIATPVAPPATVNLSLDGTLGKPKDWRRNSSATLSTFAKRNMTPRRLGDLGQRGTTAQGTFTSQHTNFTWNDSTTTAPSPSNVGVAVTGNNQGWAITHLVFSGETTTVKLYVGVRGNGTVGRVSVSMSNGGSATATITGTSDTDMIDRVVTLTLRPSSPSDTATIEYVQLSGTSSASRVAIYGVQTF